MSLRLDLLLEAINELDNMEVNGEVLTEALFEKFKSTEDKSIRKEVKGALYGKYDSTIIDSEEKLGKFIDENSDLIIKTAEITKSDILQSKKIFRKANIVRILLGLISAISAFGSSAIFGHIAYEKIAGRLKENFVKESKSMTEEYEKATKEMNENFENMRKHMRDLRKEF